MRSASKIKSSIYAWLVAMVVTLCFAETSVGAFLETPQPASGQIALSNPESVGENYDSSRYDASGYAVAPNKPALPDSYWKNKKAPDQVTPGTKSVTDQKPSSRSNETYERTTHYDEYGRSTGQTHRTSHGEPASHPNPHHHRRNPATGEQVRNPNPPGEAPKVWEGTHPDYGK